MILVIGGRSGTGRELIRLLRAAGAPLRILTRSSEAADGPDSVPGDLARPDTLDRAMAGAEKVFLLCSAADDELAWHRNAIDAAARAGVGHLVRSSILGADPASAARFIRHHGQADEHLRDSGVPYTILRPNMYMHNVSTVWPPSIGPDGSYYAPAGDARISMTDARDVAAVAARALLEDGHARKAYDVTGPEALSHADACGKLSAQLGRPVRYVPVDDETARSAMLGAGLNRWFADALIELYQDYRRSGANGYAARVHDTVRAVTGEGPRTLDRALADDLSPAAKNVNSTSRSRTAKLVALLQDTPKLADLDPGEYDAIMVAGGQAPMFSFRDDERVHAALRRFYESEKPTCVYCHGTAALVDLQLSDGGYLVDGKTVTGFANVEEDFSDAFVGQKVMPFRVEDELRQRGANYVQGGLFKAFAVRDGRLITGQQQYSARKVAQMLIEALGV